MTVQTAEAQEGRLPPHAPSRPSSSHAAGPGPPARAALNSLLPGSTATLRQRPPEDALLFDSQQFPEGQKGRPGWFGRLSVRLLLRSEPALDSLCPSPFSSPARVLSLKNNINVERRRREGREATGRRGGRHLKGGGVSGERGKNEQAAGLHKMSTGLVPQNAPLRCPGVRPHGRRGFGGSSAESNLQKVPVLAF